MWRLESSRLSDGEECLTLFKGDYVFFMYAPGRVPHQATWNIYSHGYPLEVLASRDACVKHACQVAGFDLKVEFQRRD